MVVPCTASLAITLIRGLPASPSLPTSHPAFASTAWRAALRQVTCAIWHPVTSANDAEAGRPSSSLSQVPATSSTTAATGLQA